MSSGAAILSAWNNPKTFFIVMGSVFGFYALLLVFSNLTTTISKETSNRRYFIVMIILAVISIGLYGGSIGIAMNIPGKSEDFNNIKLADLSKIMGMALGGAIASIIALVSYYIYDVRNATYYIMLIACILFGLSVAAVQIVTIEKVGVI
jgi:hypothetical protein